MKKRREVPDEEGGAVRENRAVHEENFWSSWLWEDESVKEERMAKAEKNEEEKGKRGKETRRKKRTKRRQSKENARVVFLWREIFSQEGDLESCGDFGLERLLGEA